MIGVTGSTGEGAEEPVPLGEGFGAPASLGEGSGVAIALGEGSSSEGSEMLRWENSDAKELGESGSDEMVATSQHGVRSTGARSAAIDRGTRSVTKEATESQGVLAVLGHPPAEA